MFYRFSTRMSEKIHKAGSRRPCRPIVGQLSQLAVPELVLIERACNTAPWSEQLFSDEFNASYAVVWGVRSGGALVGFIIVHSIVDELHIVNLGVLPGFRKQGFAKALMDVVTEEAITAGLSLITLEVRMSNTPALALYDKYGFVTVGCRKGYYSDNGEDAVLMTRYLSA